MYLYTYLLVQKIMNKIIFIIRFLPINIVAIILILTSTYDYNIITTANYYRIIINKYVKYKIFFL